MPMNLAVLAISLLVQATSSLPASPDRAPGRVPGPYDFRDATTLLESELPNLSGNVAVLVRQNGREIYRFQRGS